MQTFSLRLSALGIALVASAVLVSVGTLAADQAGNGKESAAKVQTAKVVVTELGFEPDKLTLRAGTPVRITFVRTTDKTCGTEVIFPALKIEKALPLNQPVVIEFTPAKAGNLTFACGMDMLHGTVVIQQ